MIQDTSIISLFFFARMLKSCFGSLLTKTPSHRALSTLGEHVVRS